MILRDYQQETIAMIKEKLLQGKKKILVVLPTGSGKSIIMGHIAKMCIGKGSTVLALMHRRQLVDQLKDRFESCGVDSGLIMAGIESDLSHMTQIGTIQTYARRIKFEELDFFSDEVKIPWFINADIVFLDEAHRSLSKTFRDVTKLYAEKIVIGFTATPTLSSGVAMGTFYDAIVQPVSVQHLINIGSLVPATYYGLSAPKLEGLKIVNGDYEKKALGKAARDKIIIGDIVTNWLKLAQNKKTIVFAVDVAHSNAIVREFKKYNIASEHLDSHSSDEDRLDAIEKFKSGETTVLSNVDLYTEGTDIPAIECVCLARPTKSIGRYIQAVGRGARPCDGKDGFIVLDHGRCVNEHGFYEDDRRWFLDGDKVRESTVKKKAVRESHKFTCDNCSAIFVGRVCPECYTEIENYGKKIEAIQADLENLNGKVKSFTFEEKKLWFQMFLHYARQKGYSDGWVSHKYREKFDVWPSRMKGLQPVCPNKEFENYLQHLKIRFVKSEKGRQWLKNKQTVDG